MVQGESGSAVAAGKDGMMSRRDEAVAVFEAWLVRDGRPAAPVSAEGDWAVTGYRDGFVFSPSGRRRSNTLYVVRGDRVAAFSPALVSLEEAYAQLGAAPEGERG